MSAPETFAPFMPHGEATPDSIAATLQGAIELLGPDEGPIISRMLDLEIEAHLGGEA